MLQTCVQPHAPESNELITGNSRRKQQYNIIVIPCRTGASANLPLVDTEPVDGGVPGVALDVLDSILEITKSLGEVHLEQVTQQVLQVCCEVGWEGPVNNGGKVTYMYPEMTHLQGLP